MGIQSLAKSVALLCALIVALEGCGTTAADRRVHKHEAADPSGTVASDTVGEFGKHGTGAGDLEEPVGIAVDQHNGDIYVVDSNHVRIEKFTSTGAFLLASGWGVADGRTLAPQTCTKRCFAGISGSGAGQFNFPEGIAVDNDPSSPAYRDVYVVDIRNHRVEKFDPRGRFLLSFGGRVNRTARRSHRSADEDICPVHDHDICGGGTQGPAGAQLELTVEGSYIAVASDGTVWVGARNRLKAFSPAGRYLSQIKLNPDPPASEDRESGGVSGLALDAADNFYVIRNNIVGVNEYTPSGKLIRTLEPGGHPAYPEGPAPSLALDPAGNVYIDIYSNYTHRIDEYNSVGVKIASFDKGEKAPPGIADKEDGIPGMAYSSLTKKLYLLNADVNVKPIVERVRVVAPPQQP